MRAIVNLLSMMTSLILSRKPVVEHTLTIVELQPTLHIYCSCHWTRIIPMYDKLESTALTIAAEAFEKHVVGYKTGGYKLGSVPNLSTSGACSAPSTSIIQTAQRAMMGPPPIPLVEPKPQEPMIKPEMLDEAYKTPWNPNAVHDSYPRTSNNKRRRHGKHYD